LGCVFLKGVYQYQKHGFSVEEIPKTAYRRVIKSSISMLLINSIFFLLQLHRKEAK
jgi:hypothetical protein